MFVEQNVCSNWRNENYDQHHIQTEGGEMSEQVEIDLGPQEKMLAECARYRAALVKILAHDCKSEEACTLSMIAGDALLNIHTKDAA